MRPHIQQDPASWSVGEQDERRDSEVQRVSLNWDDEAARPRQHSGQHASDHQQNLRRRRSSMADRVNAIRNAGGPNSLDNFARSWQRAAGFFEVVPVRNSFRYTDGAESDEYTRGEIDTSPMAQRSLLREQLENERGTPSDRRASGRHPSQVFEEEEEDVETTTTTTPSRTASNQPGASEQSPLLQERTSSQRHESIFNIEPQLASPFGGSYGTTWGSLSSRVSEPAMRHAGRLFRQQQMQGTTEPDKEREPLLVKQITEDDGKVVNVVIGQSTLPQTVFNSINVLIGVGLLALPLAMRYAGWVIGLTFLVFSALVTSYTAKILAKCADADSTIITFSDIAFVSFGSRARIVTSILFVLELIGACVALVVLFADSLDALIPGYNSTEWKVICGIVLIPLNFMPLRLLSFTSILGIISCLGIVTAVLVDGLMKPTAPGSLRDPAPTYLFPTNWYSLPIAFGLLMSPWGGHGVFPNIYRDMRHPYKYRKAVNITYSFTFLLDTLMAVLGYLIFGEGVMNEVTKNVVTTEGYPQWISILVIVFIAIIPLTKVPLNARPIVSTIEISLGLDARAMADIEALNGISGLTRGILKAAIRILCTVVFVGLAIAVPDFDRIMSLIGAVACFTICIVLPCAFHLKLFGKDMPMWQKVLDWALIVVSTVLALISTGFNCVPKDKLGL